MAESGALGESSSRGSGGGDRSRAINDIDYATNTGIGNCNDVQRNSSSMVNGNNDASSDDKRNGRPLCSALVLFLGPLFPPLWYGGCYGMCKRDASLCERWMATTSVTLAVALTGAVFWVGVYIIDCMFLVLAVPCPSPSTVENNASSFDWERVSTSALLPVWSAEVFIVLVAAILTAVYHCKTSRCASCVANLEQRVGRDPLHRLLPHFEWQLLLFFSLGWLFPPMWVAVMALPIAMQRRQNKLCCCSRSKKPSPIAPPCLGLWIAAFYLLYLVYYSLTVLTTAHYFGRRSTVEI